MNEIKNGMADAVGDIFGDDIETNSNQEVSHESGASRLGNSMCLACLSPLFMFMCLCVLGWNEKRAVCEAKAIVAGKENVKELKCTESAKESGELVMFSCDLSKDGLQEGGYTIGGTGAFASTNYLGICLSGSSSMLQCVESESSKTTKDKVGGGKTTVTTYTYKKEWKSSYVNSGNFNSKGTSSSAYDTCGKDNPSWPSDVPKSSKIYLATAKIGSFTIPNHMLTSIACDEKIPVSPLPTGWSASGDSYLKGNGNTIGSVKLGYKTNSWAADKVMHTVMGKNNAGTIEEWKAPDSWMCSGYTLTELRSGKVGKDDLFKALESANTGMTWMLRILFFLILWCSCSCLLGPLEVAVDCIPCIGPFLGDIVDAVICAVSCPPACFCCMMVCAIMWVVMRPMAGGVVIMAGLIFFCCFGAFATRSRSSRQQRAEERRQLKGNAIGVITSKE